MPPFQWLGHQVCRLLSHPCTAGYIHAYRAHRAADVVHCIVNGEAGAHAAARRVDVERDGLLRVVGFEEQQLGDDHGGHGLLDLAVQADDAFLQQAREDVGRFPPSALYGQLDLLDLRGYTYHCLGYIGYWECSRPRRMLLLLL